MYNYIYFYLFIGSNGDIRVRIYTVGFPVMFTIVGQAKGDTIVPYNLQDTNKQFFLVYTNKYNLDSLINKIRFESNDLFYAQLVISVGLMFIGIELIGKYKYAPFRV